MTLSNAEHAIVVCVIANGLLPHGAEPRAVDVLLKADMIEPARRGMPNYYNATARGRSALARHIPEREGCLIALWGERFVACKRIAADDPEEYCLGVAKSLPLLDMKLKGEL